MPDSCCIQWTTAADSPPAEASAGSSPTNGTSTGQAVWTLSTAFSSRVASAASMLLVPGLAPAPITAVTPASRAWASMASMSRVGSQSSQMSA
ncbi:hypothetical protein AB0C33_35560 [Nonomuraea sp. NPDC048881]|uniref:hypothetical protein n=1 Tax=Nonomuraea sp. NPDC048881 TaxID=3155030 RepID=UPI0033EAF1E7